MNIPLSASHPLRPALPAALDVFQRLTGTAHYHLGYFDDAQQDLDHALDRLALLDTEQCDRTAPVLDTGCGMGGTVVQLANRGFQVVGIDPSEHSIRFARAHSHNGRVRYLISRLEDFVPPTARVFGSVLMIEVTQHFACLGEALTLAGRVLRRGGSILLKDVFTHSRHPRERVPYHARVDVDAAVANAGLGVVRRRDITANVVGTLSLLRTRIDRCRSELDSIDGRAPWLPDLLELDASLAAMADAFRAGDISYESLQLARSD